MDRAYLDGAYFFGFTRWPPIHDQINTILGIACAIFSTLFAFVARSAITFSAKLGWLGVAFGGIGFAAYFFWRSDQFKLASNGYYEKVRVAKPPQQSLFRFTYGTPIDIPKLHAFVEKPDRFERVEIAIDESLFACPEGQERTQFIERFDEIWGNLAGSFAGNTKLKFLVLCLHKADHALPMIEAAKKSTSLERFELLFQGRDARMDQLVGEAFSSQHPQEQLQYFALQVNDVKYERIKEGGSVRWTQTY